MSTVSYGTWGQSFFWKIPRQNSEGIPSQSRARRHNQSVRTQHSCHTSFQTTQCIDSVHGRTAQGDFSITQSALESLHHSSPRTEHGFIHLKSEDHIAPKRPHRGNPRNTADWLLVGQTGLETNDTRTLLQGHLRSHRVSWNDFEDHRHAEAQLKANKEKKTFKKLQDDTPDWSNNLRKRRYYGSATLILLLQAILTSIYSYTTIKAITLNITVLFLLSTTTSRSCWQSKQCGLDQRTTNNDWDCNGHHPEPRSECKSKKEQTRKSTHQTNDRRYAFVFDSWNRIVSRQK